MTTSAPLLKIRQLSRTFGDESVLVDINLDIHDGEFFTVLGPSGCGKTTLLRIIAGFETTDSGSVTLGGTDLLGLVPEERPVNTVFQRYALFPHLSVFDNVAFGLRMKKIPVAETRQRVADVLSVVQLTGFEQRKPHQLSGGQQQRVALARAIINRPRILLLDESLSALDHKLRQAMQTELRQLQRQLGITFVYVTHDQEEALSLSDRILVMHHGKTQQIGTPREIYETPRNLFVAEFIGQSNRFDAVVEQVVDDQHYQVSIAGKMFPVRCANSLQPGAAVHVIVRPEDMRVTNAAGNQPEFALKGIVRDRQYKGSTLDSTIELPSGQTILASEFFDEDDPSFDYRPDQPVFVHWVPGWEVVLPRGDEHG